MYSALRSGNGHEETIFLPLQWPVDLRALMLKPEVSWYVIGISERRRQLLSPSSLKKKKRGNKKQFNSKNSEEREVIQDLDSKITCRWLFTSSFVSPSTFISSLICLGVATAQQNIREKKSQIRWIYGKWSLAIQNIHITEWMLTMISLGFSN